MTLDTRIYVLDKVDYRKVFAECGRLIGATEGTKFTDEQRKTWSRGEGIAEPGNEWWIWNAPGQGLCALLDVQYRPDAPLRTAEHVAAHDEDCNLPASEWYDANSPDCDGSEHARACWLEVSFDTAYSYTGPDGEGCGSLHAMLVAKLGNWLDERGLRWEWRNEYSGEIHSGYDGLAGLCSDGAAATGWFTRTVQPLIAAEAIVSGAEVTW